MHVIFTYRKAFYVAVTLFWLVTIGLLLQRHFGAFSLSGQRLQGSFSSPDISEEQWMGVYLNNEKIGYLSRRLSPTDNGYTMDETFRIKMIIMGTEKNIETLLNAKLDKDLKLLSFNAIIKGDLDIDVSGEVHGKNLILSIVSGGVKSAKEIRLAEVPTLNGPGVTGMLRGLRPGDRINVPTFDPTLMSIEDIELKISSKENIMSMGKMQEAYKVAGTMKGIEFTFWVTDKGEVLREESPMGFLLVKEAKEDAIKIARPSIDLISQVAVPFTMKLPAGTSYLKVRITGIDFKGLELDGGRQRLDRDILEIRREVIDSGKKKQNAKIRGHEFDEYLKSTIFIQSEDLQIVNLAREIVKDEKDPFAAARLIHEWVYKNIEKVPAVTLPVATDVLRMKKGDCNEHTTLFTALARAAGIPAKIAVGMTYRDGFFYYHAWPEFYAGKWIAADPTLGQFPADASHIRLVTGDLDRQIQILPVINKIRIEGLEFR
jgi:hypothetical protein